ncbi:MAG: 50S ribosomal protein L29 [Anaerolineae bacterium]
MKARELRELSTEELRRRLDDAYQELFNLRFQWSLGQLKNHARMTQVKRDIARLKTVLRERELQAEMGQEA